MRFCKNALKCNENRLQDVSVQFMVKVTLIPLESCTHLQNVSCPKREPTFWTWDDSSWGQETVHRGAFCHFSFQWIYYCHSSKSIGKETGKKHLCALTTSWYLHKIIIRVWNKWAQFFKKKCLKNWSKSKCVKRKLSFNFWRPIWNLNPKWNL